MVDNACPSITGQVWTPFLVVLAVRFAPWVLLELKVCKWFCSNQVQSAGFSVACDFRETATVNNLTWTTFLVEQCSWSWGFTYLQALMLYLQSDLMDQRLILSLCDEDWDFLKAQVNKIYPARKPQALTSWHDYVNDNSSSSQWAAETFLRQHLRRALRFYNFYSNNTSYRNDAISPQDLQRTGNSVQEIRCMPNDAAIIRKPGGIFANPAYLWRAMVSFFFSFLGACFESTEMRHPQSSSKANANNWSVP